MGKVSYFFLRLVLLSLSMVSIATAEAFVHSVTGNPTISMDGYFKGLPIEVGMYIDPSSMEVQVSDSDYFRVHCGNLDVPMEIIDARRIKELCKYKPEPRRFRSEDNPSRPIIISPGIYPRKAKVLTLNQIEWGYYSKKLEYNLIIKEHGGSRKTLVNVVLNPSGEGGLPYSTQLYKLNKGLLKKEKSYSILIKSEGVSSKKGVVQLADKLEIKEIERVLKKVKKTLDNKLLENYFSAIYLRNQKYYTDSIQLLSKENSSVNSIYHQYLQAKNYQLENIPSNYMMTKWIELLIKSTEDNNVFIASLACIEIQPDYHNLSKHLLDYVDANRETIKKHCTLAIPTS